jgi:hypothetical protein
LRAMDAIYVQVPAYRDHELERTLLELYGKAARPERLRVGVVWQHAEEERLSARVRALPGLEILDVPYQESGGCNWARNLLQQRWRGEPYTLLIDSHHRFPRGWDVKTVDLFSGLHEGGVAKPILTAYLPSYEPAREPGGRKKRPYRIYALGRDEGILTKLTSYPIPLWTALRRPIEADFASLHFLFTFGRFNEEVRFDPEVYLFGDEVLTGLRAFTAGYDLFHAHVVLGWHCYDRRSRTPHWDDHQQWREQQRRSLDKLRALFSGFYDGPYGLGSRRTLEDYEDVIQTRLVAPR